MKKYRIIDEEGDRYEVEEMEVEEAPVEETDACEECKDEDVVLTSDEIATLKKLLPYVDAILAMVEPKEEGVEEEEAEEVEAVDEDTEEVVDTDEVKKTCDSRSSVGAIEKTKTIVDDSLEDEVSQSWAKRFNGGK